ncbi:cytochrome P450 [Dictyobacter aurantiacus]|uniref:Cytochrome P450 n=2 Tax=Dictyobacter aurantiacus TaxID=1936993 RepID=A0A401ZMR9_9CHLR|nr:cytochrome P450 [Dictyobacter aurantiacus]
MRFLLRFRRDPIGALQELAQTYGDIVHMKLGGQHTYLLSHPDVIRDVLVVHHQQMHKPNLQQQPLGGNGLLRSEGEFHKRQRRMMQPAFHRKRITAYAEVMTGYTQQMSGRWHDKQRIDIAQEMMGLTLSIISKTMFGAEVEQDTQTVYHSFTTWMRLNSTHRFSPFDHVFNSLPLPRKKQQAEARARLDAIVYRMINERRTSGKDNGDLLSMLLLARDEEGGGDGMTDQQLRDEVMTLFLAGHETTANALAWTWYLLSQHPEVEEKLQRELDTVLAGRIPTSDDIPNLPYLEKVFTEAMRLYPPAWVIARRALDAYQVGTFTLPANSLLITSQYVVHHDARWYPDPQRFDPERWTTEARAQRPKFAYFPFGGGPRLCIGEPFAWMEGELVLATLAQKWSLRLAPGHKVEMEPLITLRPRHGLPMILHQR